MRITVNITYSREEIEAMIKTLNIISSFDDTEQSLPRNVDDLTNRAFDNLADILCLDPEGERAFHNEGW